MITCINNVKKLENGGLERLDLTIGKSYEFFEREGGKFLLIDDVGEDIKDNPLEVGNWYEESYFLPFTKEEIIKVAGIHPLKVRNIYIYGSRIYGTARSGSDYDIVMIAPHLLEHEEKKMTLNNVRLNVHVYTPDKFLADLKIHNIMNLECLFAPDWAKLQEKTVLPTEIKLKKLVQNNLAQSYSSWQGGKMKIQKYDFHRGLKSVFHSLRMLMFAAQIAEHGKIVDFSAANHLYSEIVDCDEIEWDYYRAKYLSFKEELEKKLKSYAPNEQEQNS